MTSAIDLPPRIASLAPDARFVRIPSPHGDGVLLIANTGDGVLAIAPPWSSLATSGLGPSEIAWRYGWFLEPDGGDADLDRPASEGGELSFDTVWQLRQLEPHRPFLKACLGACAVQLGRFARLRDRDTREAASERLRMVREEWARIFPDEPFPTPIAPSPPPPTARRSLTDLARQGLRAVFALDLTQAQPFLAGVADSPVEERRSGGLSFGPHVALRPPVQPGQPTELAIDFERLTQREHSLAAMSGQPVTIALVDLSDGTVLASVGIEAAAGYRTKPVDIDIADVPSSARLVVLAASS